jgi:hypothetical protein
VASHALYDEVARLINDKEKIHLIPLGVDLKRFKPDLNTNYLRERLGVKINLLCLPLRPSSLFTVLNI